MHTFFISDLYVDQEGM